MTRVLSVIPARGGSKGIPRKNIRELNEKPLVAHAIEASKAAKRVDQVVLTTDSQELAQIGHRFGVDSVIDRPPELATDEVPLAPVIEHALQTAAGTFDYVVCHQPTTPLVRPESISDGIERAEEAETDSVVFTTDETHTYWLETEDGYSQVPVDRENRQYLPTVLAEIGVFVSEANLVQEGKRVGENPALFEVTGHEGIDVDTYADWAVAKAQLQRREILYRVTGSDSTGTGHAYRGVTIADHTVDHDITFVTGKSDTLAIEILEASNYDYLTVADDEQFFELVHNRNPETIVNDILDTTTEYMSRLADTAARVVNFEDLGPGAAEADTVINALYEYSSPPGNHYYGHKYFCLRNEFRYAPAKERIDTVERVMVSFGGTDQQNLTSMALDVLAAVEKPLAIDIVIGPGYTNSERLEEQIADYSDRHSTKLNQNVSAMSKHMSAADLLLTSNGRTLYEAASLNLPVISIAQNAREQKHPYAHVNPGILSLGAAEYVGKENLRSAVEDYITSPEQREHMRQSLAEQDIENGIQRIKRILFANESKGIEI